MEKEFSISEEELLNHGVSVLGLYESNEESFYQFNSIIFHPAYRTVFRSRYEQAFLEYSILKSDTQNDSLLQDLLSLKKKIDKRIHIIKFTAERVFERQQSILDEFNFQQYSLVKDDNRALLSIRVRYLNHYLTMFY